MLCYAVGVLHKQRQENATCFEFTDYYIDGSKHRWFKNALVSFLFFVFSFF